MRSWSAGVLVVGAVWATGCTADSDRELGPGSCDSAYVRHHQGTIVVKPYDWAEAADEVYAWYDADVLWSWILDGQPAEPYEDPDLGDAHHIADFAPPIPLVLYPVVADDRPAVQPSPQHVPHVFSGSYTYAFPGLGELEVASAVRLYGYADQAGLDPDVVAEALDLSPRDYGIYTSLLERWERREAAQAAYRDLVDAFAGHDAAHIQCAIDLGDDHEIVLDEGVFHLNEPLVFEEWDGRLRGQGMDDTELQVLVGGLRRGPAPHLHVRPEVVFFLGGDYTVEELSFVVPPEATIDWMSHHWPQSAIGQFYLTGVHTGEDDGLLTPTSATLRNLRFVGGMGNMLTGEQLIEVDRFGGNLFYGASKPLTGTFIWEGWESLQAGGHFLAGAADSQVVVRDNQFTDCSTALYAMDLGGSQVEITGNTTQACSLFAMEEGHIDVDGLDLGPYPALPAEPSHFDIGHNEVHSQSLWWGSVEVFGWTSSLDRASSTLDIHDNLFDCVNHRPGASQGEDWAFEGVFAEGYDGGQIRDNTFVGTGPGSIYLGFLEAFPTGDWTITGNDFSGREETVADVRLGLGSHDVEVDGAEHPTTVEDLGQDNTLVGVTEVE